MTRVDVLNAAWLVSLLAAVAIVSGALSPQLRAAPSAAPVVVDVAGRRVPIAPYRRIASASAVADRLLIELAEPERIVALSHNGKLHDPDSYRYGARPEVSGPGDLERLIGLNVDLLIVHHLGAEAELARARASGIPVFDLGELRGLSTLQPNILAIATLLGDRARGERLWARVSRTLAAVASDIPVERRKSALYLATYAGKFYGGTRGTSYHDVLEAAGLVDIAAAKYSDWPHYDPEQLLALDPPLVVTDANMGHELCANAWLAQLSACRSNPRAIIELPSASIGDAGLGMLDAARALRDRVYGAPH